VIDRQRRPLKQTRLQVGGHPGPAREDRFHPQGGRLTRDRLREVVPLLVRDMHRFLNGMCGDPSLVGICGTGSGFLVATRTEVAVVIGTSRWPHPVFGGGPTAVDGVIRRTGPIGRVYVACTPVTGISSREPWILRRRYILGISRRWRWTVTGIGREGLLRSRTGCEGLLRTRARRKGLLRTRTGLMRRRSRTTSVGGPSSVGRGAGDRPARGVETSGVITVHDRLTPRGGVADPAVRDMRRSWSRRTRMGAAPRHPTTRRKAVGVDRTVRHSVTTGARKMVTTTALLSE